MWINIIVIPRASGLGSSINSCSRMRNQVSMDTEPEAAAALTGNASVISLRLASQGGVLSLLTTPPTPLPQCSLFLKEKKLMHTWGMSEGEQKLLSPYLKRCAANARDLHNFKIQLGIKQTILKLGEGASDSHWGWQQGLWKDRCKTKDVVRAEYLF